VRKSTNATEYESNGFGTKGKFRNLCLGVNFDNILLPAFLFKSVLRSFSLIIVWFCNFFDKRIYIGTKAAHKMFGKIDHIRASEVGL